MFTPIYRFRGIRVVDGQNLTNTDCPICLEGLGEDVTSNKAQTIHSENGVDEVSIQANRHDLGDEKRAEELCEAATDQKNTRELWQHVLCRQVFHADCIKLWRKESHSCAQCRGTLRYDRDEPRSQQEQDLYDEMNRTTNSQNTVFERWSRYWVDRNAKIVQLGPRASEERPGYTAQQEFRGAVLRARYEQTQSLQRASQGFRQSQVGEGEEIGYVSIPLTTHRLTLYGTAQANTTQDIEQQQRLAQSIARWNLFAARSGAEEGDQRFITAVSESTELFKRDVEAARLRLEKARKDDPRKAEWEEDPHNPY